MENDYLYRLYTDFECPLSRFPSLSDNFPRCPLCGGVSWGLKE